MINIKNCVDSVSRFVDDVSELFDSVPPPMKKYVEKVSQFTTAYPDRTSFDYAFEPLISFLRTHRTDIVSRNAKAILIKARILYGKSKQVYLPIGRVIQKAVQVDEDTLDIVLNHMIAILHQFIPDGSNANSHMKDVHVDNPYNIDISTEEGIFAVRFLDKIFGSMPANMTSADPTVVLSQMLTNGSITNLFKDMDALKKKNIKMSSLLKIIMDSFTNKIQQVENDIDETEVDDEDEKEEMEIQKHHAADIKDSVNVIGDFVTNLSNPEKDN